MRDGDMSGKFTMRSLCDAPELAAYRDEPQQLPAGAPGKDGFLRLGFEHRDGRSVLSELAHRAPLLAQQALYYDEGMPELPHVMMICTAGGVLQGDRYAVEIIVAENAEAHVTTQSATKIQEMDANFAAQMLDIVLGENAYLEYLPDPVHAHSWTSALKFNDSERIRRLLNSASHQVGLRSTGRSGFADPTLE